MKNVMVDLETRGTRPGCCILSIGAVAFDEKGVGETFYTVVDHASCVQAGLFEDPDTMRWWNNQSDQARKVVTESESGEGLTLTSALLNFNVFLAKHGGRNCKLWGNGADFDNTILLAAYKAVGLSTGWGLYNNRCYRTVKSLRPDLKIKRGDGTHHNALDDAVSQANHMIEILNGKLGQGLLPLIA